MLRADERYMPYVRRSCQNLCMFGETANKLQEELINMRIVKSKQSIYLNQVGIVSTGT